ncbi:AGR232Cp [Eremothecium gossypii ATCC 10895]|uniref:AGR232Cp n=1 Tax=Eremothecium gossypii (strain ATCC 10895 / CBS 109.51 / FGSC 9923 / NRRL Y-1056) TaxID=284811 RepID=Q74ZH5_EREGS|nr:AGR232Cp [Eremothecium gossypii ATCC 10895]AAS54722.1 AGR232Cp [Eremothecium gossypii ATCC 10895]AEY99053.1 FAGR232Cp [Eremothecium gossypii FDAG1]
MLTEQDIYDRLTEAIPEFYQAIITDTSAGCGQSFDVVVVSNVFANKNKLQRCRLVNKALAEQVAQLHAFSAKCYTTEEFQRLTI